MCNFPRPLFLVCLGLLPTLSYSADLPLHADSVVHLASLPEGRELLGTPDQFLEALSPFDRQARLEVDREVDQDAFVAFVQSQVRPWDDREQTHLNAVVASLRTKLAPFHLPFPKSVWLVKTTGREEGGAAYCRHQAVVLPQSKTSNAARDLERLLTHELFHILSSHNAEFRRRCYAVIGFRVVTPVELPEPIRDRRITNPDGPLPDAVIDVRLNSDNHTVVPVIYSSQPKFDPQTGGPFFKYVTFRLLVAEPHDGGWRGAIRDGKPWLVSPDQVPDYASQIGANTNYIIHPDEILADNFVHVVHQTTNLRTPLIADGLRRVLAGEEAATK